MRALHVLTGEMGRTSWWQLA